MNLDNKFSHSRLKSEHFSSRFNNLVLNEKPNSANSVNESKKSRFAEYMDKINASIIESDVNQLLPQKTLNIGKHANSSFDHVQKENKRVSTAVSAYKDEVVINQGIKPRIMQNQIWKSAGRRKLRMFPQYVASKLYLHFCFKLNLIYTDELKYRKANQII